MPRLVQYVSRPLIVNPTPSRAAAASFETI
jgi:hypothetical protein